MKTKKCTICGVIFLGDKYRMRCYGLCSQGIREVKEAKKKRLYKFTRHLHGVCFVREKIRIRDNHTCQKCGKKWIFGERRFDVHHIDGDKRKTRQYDNLMKEWFNMITLCHRCHFSLEITKRAIRKENRNAIATCG